MRDRATGVPVTHSGAEVPSVCARVRRRPTVASPSSPSGHAGNDRVGGPARRNRPADRRSRDHRLGRTDPRGGRQLRPRERIDRELLARRFRQQGRRRSDGSRCQWHRHRGRRVRPPQRHDHDPPARQVHRRRCVAVHTARPLGRRAGSRRQTPDQLGLQRRRRRPRADVAAGRSAHPHQPLCRDRLLRLQITGRRSGRRRDLCRLRDPRRQHRTRRPTARLPHPRRANRRSPMPAAATTRSSARTASGTRTRRRHRQDEAPATVRQSRACRQPSNGSRSIHSRPAAW